jgi:hypothetical protein
MSSEQLTPEAHAVLTSQLATRRIDLNEHLTEREKFCSAPIERRAPRSRPFFRDPHTVGDFVTEMFVCTTASSGYSSSCAPAVVVGYIAIATARNEVREILGHLPRGIEALSYHTQILEIWLTNLAGSLISWMAFCFSFAAICFALRQIEAGAIPSVSDSFIAVRERMGAFLRLALLLFFLFLVAEAASAAVLGCFLGIASAAASPERCHHSTRRSCVLRRKATRLVPLWARDTCVYLGQL